MQAQRKSTLVKKHRLGTGFFSLISPIKVFLGEPDCAVHSAITQSALQILESRAPDAYAWYTREWDALERGLIWADAGFKSASHFFFPYGRRNGLRGQHSGLHLAGNYMELARRLAQIDQKRIATFYIGAALHIIQDASVPQHATLKLANRHRAFENFVRGHIHTLAEACDAPPVRFDELREYIHFNARVALKAHRLFAAIQDENLRFQRTMQCVVPVARRTSAGALAWFYDSLLFPIS